MRPCENDAMRLAALVVALSSTLTAQTSFTELAKLFENRPAADTEVKMQAAETTRRGVRIFDYSFASPVAGSVPGTLVLPAKANGKLPVILFGHWMMEGSPLRNRGEFLEEAVVLSRAGAMCLLLDTPLVRPGVILQPDPMEGQEALAAIQMTREWRRALELLLARPDADVSRVAYVGHSFSAGVGARLAAVEKRIHSFVLMANVYSLRDLVFDDHNPEMAAYRKSKGDAWLNAYFEKFPTEDGAVFAQRSAPAAILVQNGRLDKPMPEHVVKKTFAYLQEPKRLEFYDAGHELNAKARHDRVAWLQKRLKLKAVDHKALEAIPLLR